MTYDLSQYPIKDTINMISYKLEKDVEENERVYTQERRKSVSHAISCFRARSIPSISIHAYLTRILKYCPCANECFLAVLVYFDRMTKSVNSHAAGFKVDSYNLHRLLIAGVMVSSKLFSDVFFTNTRYAKVGGIPISELNLLEVEFLSINNYNLFISLEEMQSYGDHLLAYCSMGKVHLPSMELPPKEDMNDLAPPIRRRARHLSIDHQADGIIIKNDEDGVTME